MKNTVERYEISERLKSVIIRHCNTHGCDNCDLKFSLEKNGPCTATHLQDKLIEIDMKNI